MGSKTLFVTIAGKANAGKSSLMNALVGEKIAMVSDKPQTTRTKITGVLTKGELQYVFIDTPGVHKARTKLGEHMNRTVRDSIAGVDAAIFVADVTSKIMDSEKNLLASFKASKTPVVLALNKIDLVENKEQIAVKIAQFASLHDFAAIVPVSVLENDGVDIVMEEVGKFAVDGPHYYPDDKLTDQPEGVLAAEMIREKILQLTYEEVPHGIAVTVERMSERTTASGEDILDIEAVVFCEKDSHKGMIIGKRGSMLKRIGSAAREDLESFFRIKVNLNLWVKVKEDWRNREGIIRNFGLSNNSSDK